jgi:hypothetical protein
MSDVSYNVEDGPPPPDTPAPEPVTPEPAAPPVAAAPEEPETQEIAGQKMVPLPALQAAREEARALKQKAEQFDQVSSWYAQNKPYVDFLQANPDLLKPRQATPAAPQAPPPPETDPELIELARTLDLYTPDGKPDAVRAAKTAAFFDKRADVRTQEAVRPIQEQTYQERSQQNYRDALTMTLPNGDKVNPEIINQIWRNGNPKDLANPNLAAFAIMAAIGMQTYTKASQPPPIQPPETTPVVTEPSGSRTPNRAPISEFEQRVANIRGISPQKYAEYTRNFRTGQSNVLEND